MSIVKKYGFTLGLGQYLCKGFEPEKVSFTSTNSYFRNAPEIVYSLNLLEKTYKHVLAIGPGLFEIVILSELLGRNGGGEIHVIEPDPAIAELVTRYFDPDRDMLLEVSFSGLEQVFYAPATPGKNMQLRAPDRVLKDLTILLQFDLLSCFGLSSLKVHNRAIEDLLSDSLRIATIPENVSGRVYKSKLHGFVPREKYDLVVSFFSAMYDFLAGREIAEKSFESIVNSLHCESVFHYGATYGPQIILLEMAVEHRSDLILRELCIRELHVIKKSGNYEGGHLQERLRVRMDAIYCNRNSTEGKLLSLCRELRLMGISFEVHKNVPYKQLVTMMIKYNGLGLSTDGKHIVAYVFRENLDSYIVVLIYQLDAVKFGEVLPCRCQSLLFL